MPMVQEFVVSVLIAQDGFQYTENIITEYGFMQNYFCMMWAERHSFDWNYSANSGKVLIDGTPAVHVDPAFALTAPRPDTLQCELYIDGELVGTEETDVYSLFYDDAPEQPDYGTDTSVSNLVIYPGHDIPQTYECSQEPHSVRWEFTLTDTAGNTFSDSLEW